jgi:MFS family permease
MFKTLKKYHRILCQAVPSLIAISIVEVVNVEVYLVGPVSKSALMLFVWIILQMVPGFLFGYISDCNFRKASLIICQLLGLVGGLILSLFGFEIWVLILIALTFNPLPVARAALLDHFPQHSPVKLVAITFLAQYIPWAFFDFFMVIPYKIVIFCTLGLLGINTILTIFLFKDDVSKLHKEENTNKINILKRNSNLIFTLGAFILAETTFYLLWAYLEFNPQGPSWLSMTTFATLIGIIIAMLYHRLPHLSIITLFYSIGGAITIIALTHCILNKALCEYSLLTSMQYYGIIGGLYLPFVTDAVIKIVGPRRRALGSAMIEFGDTISSFSAPILNIIFKQSSISILITIVCFYVLASCLQKFAEEEFHVK